MPVERIRVVTVPPSGASSSTLLERFAAATQLPIPLRGREEVLKRNVSLGAAEVELIRRLNESVVGPLSVHQYRHVIEQGIRPGLSVEGSRPLRLPREHLPWAREYSQNLVAELRQRGTPVFGDLADLLPQETPPSTGGSTTCPRPSCSAPPRPHSPRSPSPTAACSGGTGAPSSRRRAGPRVPTELLGSTARAAGFRLRRAALEGTSVSDALAWAAGRHLGPRLWPRQR